HSRSLLIRRRHIRPLLPPAPTHLNAGLYCWPNGQPDHKHNRSPELPAAIVSVARVSVTKTEPESAMVKPLQHVLVAQGSAPEEQAGTKTKDVACKSRFSIGASRTLSEKL